MFALALLACACAAAEIYRVDALRLYVENDRRERAIGSSETPLGCTYEGRWYTDGSAVSTHEPCLRCTCAHGALACRRRACSPLPDPPPHRCHVLHRRGSCCPELHCPDRVTLMEHGASARFETEDYSDIATPASISHVFPACVESGTVYAAGSAMGSNTACEQCFCLAGARRCVRPRCLPPPPGCRARPAPGACCPQRYYCEHLTTKPPDQKHPHDCEVDGKLVSEGKRVVTADAASNCTQCFCLRGSVRCQPLACAPPLLGCKPLLRPGQCCPHQYQCEHQHHGLVTPNFLSIADNALISTKNEDRSFHTFKSTKRETTPISSTTLSGVTKKNTSTISVTKKQFITTTKVKRKTNEPPPTNSSRKPIENTSVSKTSTREITTTTIKLPASREEASTTDQTTEKMPTDQPEGSVKIVINGTINCTAELSSTSLPLNFTSEEIEKIKMQAEPRIPYVEATGIEAQTYNPNDIITDRSVNGGFDENETFTINVTSSLNANNNHSTSGSPISVATKTTVPVDVAVTNSSDKKSKDNYDYDYTEPTLPPSLPNLKIIPFVAADAVVEDDISSKVTLTYPVLEREDKFPVYYPSSNAKDVPFATRREDVYHPTKYPVLKSEELEAPQYPSLMHNIDITNGEYPNINSDLVTPLREYTRPTLIGNRVTDKTVTKIPTTSTTFKIKTPVVNLFSPPVETEGGFIPKGPGIINEYFPVYPSTPSGPSVPHLTTSMQLDTSKGDCISGDGRRIPEGESISLACSICTCAWSEIHCSPRPCNTPLGCNRRPANSNAADLCCGELVCHKDNNNYTTPMPTLFSSTKPEENENKLPVPNKDQNNVLTHNQTETKMDIPTRSPSVSNNTLQNDAINKITITKNKTSVANRTDNQNVTTISLSSTEKPSTIDHLSTTSTTKTTLEHSSTNQTTSQYEYEDDDEEEFSLGSVLKLLLSETYDTTTASNKRNPVTTTKMPATVRLTTQNTLTTTKRLPPKPTIGPFIPMPPHSYIPQKRIPPQNTVNRIDHLVLGEATPIQKTTLRPVSFQYKPVTTSKPVAKTTTESPTEKTFHVEMKQEENSEQITSVTHAVSRLPSSTPASLVPGILKLAGCNIYGRMYRVGRIITELSTPCLECRCTELGVQCHSLNC